MAYKFQTGVARMSGSLIQEGPLDVYDHSGNQKFVVGIDGAVSADGAVTAGGNVTAVGSFIIGSADLDETDLEKLDGITDGAAANNKAMVLNGSKTITGITSLTSTDLIGTNVDGIIGADTARVGTFTALSGTTLGATAVTANSLDLQGGTATVGGLTAEANLDIGAFDLRAATLTADGLTAARVVFAGTDGVLSDDADFSFATDTLTVTKLGAYEQAGSVDFSDEAMTNVNIDSGAIDATAIGATTQAAAQFTTISGSGGLQVGGVSWYSGDLKPTIDSTTNLGSSALRFSTIYVDSIVGADVAKDVQKLAVGNAVSASTDFALVTSGDGGTVTMSAASAGKTVFIKLSGGVGDVILAAAAGDTIESAASIRLESTGSAVALIALDATAWFIV